MPAYIEPKKYYNEVSEMSASTFPQALKLSRNIAKITQKELAEKTGLSLTSIKYWETGRTLPSHGNFKKLVAYYEQKDFQKGAIVKQLENSFIYSKGMK